MKTRIFTMLVVAMAIGTAFVSCKGNETNNSTSASATTGDTAQELTDSDVIAMAINQYLTDSIGSYYDKAQVCIPTADIVATDTTADGEIVVLGDFRVYNYDISGDTLKFVSGGDHPGALRLADNGNRLAVSAFDGVADGSDNIPSAKRIFGQHYDRYSKNTSDENRREDIRRKAIAAYAEANNLTVKFYQDYGWPAKSIY